jgi:Domain of unknown function (DUF4384)
MISALLLPLLTGVTAPVAAPVQDDPPIEIWISNDRRFLPGDAAKVQVRTEEDGYLIVFHVDPDGHLRVLFPLDPDKDNFVRGGKKYEVRGRGGREAFEVHGKGRGTVYAAVSRAPFRFDGFIQADHWDYRALAPARLSSDPETELNELAQRMAQGSFDYDILAYDVVERVVYASDYSTRYYYSDPYYYDRWCHFSCGRPYFGHISIGLFFGRPYRRYYYDPYFYAYHPIYNPFFYDPYYYGYYPRYWYPYRPYRHYYDYPRRFYHDRSYDGWRTPYRFRGSDGLSGFGDRYVVRRAVNTVYTPPISRVRESTTGARARRVLDSPGEELPRGVAPSRLRDDARRVQGQPVEARRAREREATRSAAPPGGRNAGMHEARPARRTIQPSRDNEHRGEPRLERRRVEPRAPERAPEARPARRESDRGSAARSPDRGGRPAEGRSWSGGGGRASGGGGGGGQRPSGGTSSGGGSRRGR